MTETRESSGAQLFARYAYPPNELGYCGPAGSDRLLEAVSGAGPDEHVDAAEIARRAREFEGAWVYLELIAEAAGIPDPLDRRVVEAYWTGNELLDGVDPAWFRDRLQRFLARQPGGQWAHGLGPEPGRSDRPVHAFHVFAVYPWVGLLARDSDVPRTVLDSCRIRTGPVVELRDDVAVVDAGRLDWDGSALDSSMRQRVEARWRVDGLSLLPAVAVGDVVSVHWDWVCDIVRPEQVRWLERVEREQVDAANARLRRGRDPG